MASILIADADKNARREAVRVLGDQGHVLTEADRADNALDLLDARRPDLLLVEWSLPDQSGIDLVRRLRGNTEASPTRVLMTSGRGRVTDVVSAFEAGADDFVAKPYAIEELVARVSAALRRPVANHASGSTCVGGIKIENQSQRVFVDGERVSLAPREYRLLLFLMSNCDRVFSRRQLLTNVWDRNSRVGPRTVDVHVRRLRSLLEPFGYDHFLQTVRGSGYRFSTGN